MSTPVSGGGSGDSAALTYGRELAHERSSARKNQEIDSTATEEQAIAQIRDLEVFNEDIFMRDVYYSITNTLGVTKAEMKGPRVKKSLAGV